MRIDSVQIGVLDIDEACDSYALLLGVPPIERAEGVRRFQLGRGAVELEGGEPGLHAIRFVLDEPRRTPLPDSFHGLDVRVERCGEAPAPGTVSTVVEGIDHVVVQSADPDRAIALWRDRVGLRLAVDRIIPERGLRLVFFRSGGITFEFASSHPPPATANGHDRFHGVSYRVFDLASHRDHLLAAGIDVSPIRQGMRPGTCVATVRSGTAGVPTLLLEVVRPDREAA
jgi:catechol 2,3-dioxygenase-like lactoylglutathione lyase family enzyme